MTKRTVSTLAALLTGGALAVDPLSGVDPTTLGYQPTGRSGDALPSDALWSSDMSANPLPTNEWWENAAVGTGGEDTNLVFQNPYAFIATEQGVKVMYPFTQEVNNIWEAEVDAVVSPVTLGSVTSAAYSVKNATDLGVTLEWPAAGFTAPLVQGSPYVTAFYDGLTSPEVSADQMSFDWAVDGANVTCGASDGGARSFLGSRFETSFVQSDARWAVYAQEPVEFDCSSTSTSLFSLTLPADYSGFLRIALVNNCTAGSDPHGFCTVAGEADEHDDYAEALAVAAGTVAVGGDVSYAVTSSGVQVTFEWDVVKTGDAALLSLALPHHTATLADDAQVSTTMGHRTVKGWMPLVEGDSWTLDLDNPEPAFLAPRDIGADYLSSVLDALLTGDAPDANYTPAVNYQIGAGDPYYAGKQLAKMAQIALIAEEVGETSVREDMITKLENYSAVWLDDSSLNPLLYDQAWGGLVSCGCQYNDCGGTCTPFCDNSYPTCPALTDSGWDFGNAYYNDHHFHYGYHIYAHAVIAKFDPEWALAHLEQTLVMVRDIANPSASDGYFPQMRYMDWFAGHSWASGIASPTSLGKNQESTSEAFNAWYGMALWGQALSTADSTGAAARVEELGTTLMAMEAKGAQTYWHTMTGNDIYPADFTELHCVGILWSGSAQYQTWFGTQTYYIHGIQMLPFTPASEVLLNADWLAEEVSVYADSCDATCEEQGWSTPVALATSVNDQAAGWALAQALTDDMFDNGNAGGNGNSRTASYYFVATRT